MASSSLKAGISRSMNILSLVFLHNTDGITDMAQPALAQDIKFI